MYENNPNNNFEKYVFDRKPMNTLSLYVLLFFILPSLLFLLFSSFTSNELFINANINLTVYIIAFIAFILYLKDYILADYHEIKTQKVNLFLSLLIGYLILLAGNYLSNIIMTILNLTEDSQNQQTIETLLTGGYLVHMFITSVICAPVVEELVFRKAIFKISKTPVMGIVISSICFGLIHVINGGDFIYSIPYIISGVAFGIVYIKNNMNIIPCILLHALSNFIAIIGTVFLAGL